MWEETPNSGQYYHSVATFYGNGRVATLQLASPNVTTLSYGIDGEGRWSDLEDETATIGIVSIVNYNAFGEPVTVILSDQYQVDNYGYDPNSGRMTSWSYDVSGTIESANLKWNANGTLQKMAITDGFNSGGTQTICFNSSCAPGTGYDDLGRLIGSSAGTGGAIWNQTDSYDQYDNLTKTSTGYVTWNPGYSATTNHYACSGCTTDASGNVTFDGTNYYVWDGYNKMKTVNPSDNLCSTGGQCIVYDAFGRVVEIESFGGGTEIWYTQLGKTAYMTGSTFNYAYFPAPGGGTYFRTGLGANAKFNFMHKDYLGNARIVSSITGDYLLTDRAYAPYGEIYNIFGVTSQNEGMFTGSTQDILNGMYDTPNRELQGSQQGRWLSPDPAGAGWNQYAYATNPNSSIDPLGLTPYLYQPPPESDTFTLGNDEFDGIGDAPGTYSGFDMYGNFTWGSSVDQWKSYFASLSTIEYYFTNADGSPQQNLTPFQQQWNLAAIKFGLQAFNAGYCSDALSCIQQTFNTMTLALNDNGTPALEGGNYEFSYATIQINGQSVDPADFGCLASRCGIFDSLDYSSGNGHAPDSFHVDTANPLFFPVGTLAHFGWDIVGGNTVWNADGIPRPWWE